MTANAGAGWATSGWCGSSAVEGWGSFTRRCRNRSGVEWRSRSCQRPQRLTPALSRFQIEARAAACLQHTHIVPIHAVGEIDGIPYYAMQLIVGMSLARVIANLRQFIAPDEEEENAAGGENSSSLDTLVASLLSGHLDSSRQGAESEIGTCDSMVSPSPAGTAPATLPRRPMGDAVVRAVRSASYFRSIARLGIQAAEALEYAHAQRVVHRDIKPANLLLDARGCLWVADFGMAMLPGDSRVTQTGELLGTLRYMSPEQATGQRVLVDRRTDIYSLGVTLYELLALEPAFGGSSPPEILARVSEAEVAPLRSANAAIPRDLATIVAKAMAKDPAARYLTAQHLADDLGRFVEGRPVAARPAPSWQRAVKWRSAGRRLRRYSWSFRCFCLRYSRWASGLTGESASRRARRRSGPSRNLERAPYRSELRPSWRWAGGWRWRKAARWAGGYSGCCVGWNSLRRRRPTCDGQPSSTSLPGVSAAPVPRVVQASGAPVNALALSPDGRMIAGGGDDGSLRVWETDTGNRIGEAQGPFGKFESIVFDPSGRFLAATHTSGRAELWQLKPFRRRGEPISFAPTSTIRSRFIRTDGGFCRPAPMAWFNSEVLRAGSRLVSGCTDMTAPWTLCAGWRCGLVATKS